MGSTLSVDQAKGRSAGLGCLRREGKDGPAWAAWCAMLGFGWRTGLGQKGWCWGSRPEAGLTGQGRLRGLGWAEGVRRVGFGRLGGLEPN